MWCCISNLWTTLTRFVDRVSQVIFGWFGNDRRCVKATAEGQVVSKASVELASIRNTTYAASAQAEIALHGYRTLYQQITLPEVRNELLPPAGLSIVLVGGVWRIMNQAEARNVKAVHGQRKAGKQHRRRADVRLACVG